MSRKQRRDHHPVPGALPDGSVGCMTCGERLQQVTTHYSGDLVIYEYWRHLKRWQKEPLR